MNNSDFIKCCIMHFSFLEKNGFKISVYDNRVNYGYTNYNISINFEDYFEITISFIYSNEVISLLEFSRFLGLNSDIIDFVVSNQVKNVDYLNTYLSKAAIVVDEIVKNISYNPKVLTNCCSKISEDRNEQYILHEVNTICRQLDALWHSKEFNRYLSLYYKTEHNIRNHSRFALFSMRANYIEKQQTAE